jgi:ubiquitin-protein ligase
MEDDNERRLKREQEHALLQAEYIRSWRLILELKFLPRFIPQGVYCLPSLDSLFEWSGTIFLRQGLYRNGVFHFRISLPADYPKHAPTRVQFVGAAVYHPQVRVDTNDLSLARSEFANNWDGEKHGLLAVLKYVKKIFYQIEAASFVNMEAAELYLNNRKQFEVNVQRCVTASNRDDALYHFASSAAAKDKQSSIVFRPWQKEHDTVMSVCLARGTDDGSSDGMISSTSSTDSSTTTNILSLVSSFSKLLKQ